MHHRGDLFQKFWDNEELHHNFISQLEYTSHSLSTKKFSMLSLLAKTKGGGRSPSAEKSSDRNFWPMGQGSKIWPSGKNQLVWPGSSTILFLNQKQKSYVILKLVNSEFLKNMVVPLWNDLYLGCYVQIY